MISVVIPTLEEEKYLPFLLIDLKKQVRTPDEVIVVDAGSTDKTVQVAKKKGARVYISVRKSAAHQRNIGAKNARGDILIFIDADIRIPSSMLLSEVEESLSKNVGAVARCEVIGVERTWKDRLLCTPMNLLARCLPKWVGRGGFIVVRAEIFHKVGGFDERRAVSEDVDFFRRVATTGSVACLKCGVEESGRRYRVQGYVRTVLQWFYNGVWAFFTDHSLDKEWRPVR